MNRANGWRADERGQVGGVESLVFGVLVLVLGTLGMASAWSVVDAKVATASAAREATRTYLESDGSDAGWDEASQRAAEAFAGHGRDPAHLTVERPTGDLTRCEPVTVVASTAVALPGLPGLRALGHRVMVRSRHTEVVDPYRSGLARRAGGACA